MVLKEKAYEVEGLDIHELEEMKDSFKKIVWMKKENYKVDYLVLYSLLEKMRSCVYHMRLFMRTHTKKIFRMKSQFVKNQQLKIRSAECC